MPDVLSRGLTTGISSPTKKEKKKKKKKPYQSDFYMELHKVTNYIKIYKSVFYNRVTKNEAAYQKRVLDKLGIKPSKQTNQ